MSIVKYKNQSGITYAYESTSSYDPVTKQSRPKRKYLGRVDDETGEIISTKGKRGRPRKDPSDKKDSKDPKDYKELYLDKSTGMPTKLIIKDSSNKPKIIIEYTSIKTL